jgi:predicted RNA-binding Zn-ribbon protein involved in translation (DUF1610 family)
LKILLLDIETAPNVVHVWGLWQQNVGINQILDSGYVMCWAAKWLGHDQIFFDSVKASGAKRMLEQVHALIEQADAIIHYNGNKFDIPTLNKEFLLHKMLPPAPPKQIDLLRVAKSQFRFPSNKLDYVAKALGVGQKIKHAGHELWIRCLANEEAAWKEMQEYNVNDVIILEAVYHRLLPWIKNHPNVGLHHDVNDVCPNCGSHHLERRGFSYTAAAKYQRYQCKACGTWSRGKTNEAMKHIVGQDKN